MFRRAATSLTLCLGLTTLATAAPEVTPGQVASMLAGLHPDYSLYINDVHYGASRLHPATLYAGLVRRGGLDPADPGDGPRAGRGVTNDLVVYADTFEPWRTPAWRLLLLDHEYFHARHFGRGFPIPNVGFGQARADADYQEGLAWGYVLQRAAEGVYGELSVSERSEVAARYQERFDRFHAFVMKRQAAAWAHYGRFMPEPDPLIAQVMRAGVAPTAGSAPPAGTATR